ncbi:hypothetical protein MA16_Dca014647 [Dendrobium catenatum]|uniref:DUF4378 domain-containing protein n=1 Tax=Dendrobium catenatum TaxID=906689 RepID=A0A2I0WYR9_9ASPA|nr:hypothetical protein MA16_Dca014647 [Dendrobium catenatum]
MASPSLSNFSTQLGRRMLSEFLQEPQEPFLFEMRKLSNQGGIRNGRAAAFLKRVLAKLAYGKTSSADNRKSSVFSCFSDYSNDHQLSPVSVLELQYSDESSPSLDDHSSNLASAVIKDECPLPPGADSTMENSIILEEIHDKSVSFNKRRRLLLECWRKETEERILSFEDRLSCSDMSEKAMNEQIFSWEKQKGDSSCCREEWNQFKAEAREIGLCLEAAIFDELREETILDTLALYCT